MTVIVGTIFDDDGSFFPVLNATNASDTVFGLTGDDVIEGFKGNDVLFGGKGSDFILGSQGNDLIYGDDGNFNTDGPFGENDSLFGGAGADTIFGEDDDDWVAGGADNDKLYGGLNDDYVNGGKGNDTVEGNDGDDYVDGGAGNDKVFGDGSTFGQSDETGNDIIWGGLGNDQLRGDGPTIGLLGNVGLDIFVWDQDSATGTSTASNVEVDTILDFHALPTIVDGILGIDHIDLSGVVSIDEYIDDPSRIKIVNGTVGDGFLQVLVDTNDDAKGAYDLKINVFTNSDANWNIGVTGNSNAEIWLS